MAYSRVAPLRSVREAVERPWVLEGLIKSMIAHVHAAIQHLKAAAEQLPKLDRWRVLLAYLYLPAHRRSDRPANPAAGALGTRVTAVFGFMPRGPLAMSVQPIEGPARGALHARPESRDHNLLQVPAKRSYSLILRAHPTERRGRKASGLKLKSQDSGDAVTVGEARRSSARRCDVSLCARTAWRGGLAARVTR